MTDLPVTLDYGRAMASTIGPGGLEDSDLTGARAELEEAIARVVARGQDGSLGFWRLPDDRDGAASILRYAARLPATLRDVLVLGIGGSSLGTRAVLAALTGPPELAWRSAGRRVHLPDNSDPGLLAALLEALDPASTLCVVISKSGGTVETAAQLLIVRAWLAAALGAERARGHTVAITDPTSGTLRALANAERLTTFAIPSTVGGRFSVLSPVGLLPAALAGVDIEALLAGATRMREACERRDATANPAALLAAVHVLGHRRAGRAVHVLMPYSDALRPFAAWYVQLWAESLGKRTSRTGERVETGPTPIAAVGATDQHAQVQLFMEGPRDKIVTFVRVRRHDVDLPIPASEGELSYLGGRTLAELLDAELRGTAEALARDGRPSITLELDRLDGERLGGLFFLYEAATAFAGELYDVNAFDQPGVEEGKRLTSGLLGRPGFDGARAEIEARETARSTRYRVP